MKQPAAQKRIQQTLNPTGAVSGSCGVFMIIESNGSILLSMYCVENYGYQNVMQQKRMLKADESMN